MSDKKNNPVSLSNGSKANEKVQNNLGSFYSKTDETIWLRSCEEEVTQPIEGKVTGIIPEWINGSLYRNGPGLLKFGDQEFKHLFDSSALLHKFRLKGGKVTYQCRFVNSEAYKKNKSANRIILSEFGTKTVNDPCQTIFKRISAMFYAELSDNANISLYPFGDELYAFNETPFIHKIDIETLETLERVSLREYISILHHTSHPHVTKDGTVYNLALTLYPTGPHHAIVAFPAIENGQEKAMFEAAQIVASIPARWPFNPSYMHTFGLTENYFIIVEQPLCISFTGIVAAKWSNKPAATCLKWYQNEYTRINIISRKNGKLCKVFHSEAFFYLHIIQQFEEEEHIILDICVYKDPSMLNCMYIESLKSMKYNPNYAKMFRSRPTRFVLPMKPEPKCEANVNLIKLNNTTAQAYYLENGDIMVKAETICDIGCETPRINYDSNLGKPYRYFYAISSDVDSEKTGCIIKVDTICKTFVIWWEDQCYASEPIFVESPNAKREDDGVVLSALLWGGTDTNHVGLLLLDAKTFTEIGRAEFVTPGPVPKCLHGWFLAHK